MFVNSHIRAVARGFPETSGHDNSLQSELYAMQQIAVALAQLNEPTRTRVLHWAGQRSRDAVPVVVIAPAPLSAVGGLRAGSEPDGPADEALAVSTLADFFEPREPKASKPRATDAVGQSVTGMLSDFVVEFQSMACEWNVAYAVPSGGSAAETVRPGVSEQTGSQRASSAT